MSRTIVRRVASRLVHRRRRRADGWASVYRGCFDVEAADAAGDGRPGDGDG